MNIEISPNGTIFRNRIEKDCLKMLNTRNFGVCTTASLIDQPFRDAFLCWAASIHPEINS